MLILGDFEVKVVLYLGVDFFRAIYIVELREEIINLIDRFGYYFNIELGINWFVIFK